ncbi:hypothetical protein NLU13_7496 [Sarocladium strictum]|uniref:Uncharacterized protein n=1 Tax=Sarocladium strictum TaxID=5046 RepID=A0AA39GE36_SARSR|nr:hypothetical protein NLU13_7496 [Sarocladium strictum]
MPSQRPEHDTMSAWSSAELREQATVPDDAASAHLSWASKRRRVATVYDTVAGKVSYDQALRNIDNETSELLQGSSNLATNPTNRPTPYPPEEVLFRRRNAPVRYAEHDVYFANERDFPDAGQGVLPDSDLLAAVHGYTSNFYEAVAKRELRGGARPERNVDERSMDETALLAFGILLEEAGREVLGRRGDLVFTEEADTPEASDDDEMTGEASRNTQSRARSTDTSKAKRRKLADP